MRKITPHKNGRTTQMQARLTPDEKKVIQAILKKEGLSLSDWIMKQVKENESGET